MKDSGDPFADLARATQELRARLSGSFPPGELVDSRSLLRAAVADDPQRWHGVQAKEPEMVGHEGGLVFDTGWTIVACEALLVAQHLPDLGRSADIHDVAAAGALVPLASAIDGIAPPPFPPILTVLGLSPTGIAGAMGAAAATTGGAILEKRILEDTPARDVPGDWGSSPNPLAGQIISGRKQLDRPPRPPAPAVDRIQDQGPDPVTPLDTLVRSWRPVPRILWWSRPIVTAAALVTLTVSLVGEQPPAWWAFVGAALLTVLVRPVRRVWPAAALLAVLSVSVTAGVFLAVRTLITYLAIWLDGEGFSNGVDRLVRRRSQLLDEKDPAFTLDGAWNRLRLTLDDSSEDMPLETSFFVLAACWAQVDTPLLVRTSAQLVRGHLTGHWPFGHRYSMWTLLLRFLWRERLFSRTLQLIALAAGAAFGWFLTEPGTRTLLAHDVTQIVAALVSALLAARVAAVPLQDLTDGTVESGERASGPGPAFLALGRVGVIRLVAMTAVLIWFSRTPWLSILACLVVGVLIALIRYRLVGQVHLVEAFRAPRLPWPGRWSGHAAAWKAAELARSSGRRDTSRSLWSALAARADVVDSIRSLSFAMLALDALDRAQWQSANQLIAEAYGVPGPGKPAVRTVDAVAARVWLVTGAKFRALDAIRRLEQTRAGRRLLRAPADRMTRAKVLAETGHSEEAMLVLSRQLPGRAFSAALLEAEISIGETIGQEAPDVAATRLRGVLEFADMPEQFRSASVADMRDLARTTAKARLILGLQLIRLDRLGEAEDELRFAVRSLPDTADLAERATARILLGHVRARRGNQGEGFALVEAGLQELESARSQLRMSGQRRSMVVSLGLTHSLALDTLVRVSESDQRAAAVAVVLLESLRQDALASLLRSGGMPPGVLSDEAAARLDDLESNLGRTPEEESELIGLRERLAGALSGVYADTYSPAALSASDIRGRLGGADLLAFRIRTGSSDRLEGHTVWWPSEGRPQVIAFSIDDPAALALLGAGEEGARQHLLRADLIEGSPQWSVWSTLASALLPTHAQNAFMAASEQAPRSLVIVPDGRLAALPWAALRLPDKRVLLETAQLQVIPAVALLRPQRSRISLAASTESRVVLHEAEPIVAESRQLLTALSHPVAAPTLASLRSALSGHAVAGAYFAAHGHGEGSEQAVDLADSSNLTTPHALTLRWPPWVVFASCFVGSPDIAPGTEPSGVTISCLLGGADTVVAGVIPVQQAIADRICVGAVARLLDGLHPAAALRAAQLAIIRRRPRASVHRWAGFTCTTRLVPSRPALVPAGADQGYSRD